LYLLVLVDAHTSVPYRNFTPVPLHILKFSSEHSIISFFIALLPVLGKLTYRSLMPLHSLHTIIYFNIFFMIFVLQRLVLCCYYFTFSSYFYIPPEWPQQCTYFTQKLSVYIAFFCFPILFYKDSPNLAFACCILSFLCNCINFFGLILL